MESSARGAFDLPRLSPNILALPQPDWLRHELVIAGPQERVRDFRAAASGAGIVPWIYDYDQKEEEWYLRLLDCPAYPRDMSQAAARAVARRLRDLSWTSHENAVSSLGADRSCPFDLYALIPVPLEILRLGHNDPEAIAWLWRNWGTTWSLRRVCELAPSPATLAALPAEHAAFRCSFWSADWTPWPALNLVRNRFCDLTLSLKIDY